MKEVQPVETASPSQEIRLLAAISHASVLFTNIGFFIPMVVYLTQKKKSSYLGFQALQALIWQIAMFVFTIVTSSCMVGSIFIPALLASASPTVSPTERPLELWIAEAFVVGLIIGFLVIFGNLAFMIYGIIAAIMTYQGKDFRYIFIGNRLEKHKSSQPINSA